MTNELQAGQRRCRPEIAVALLATWGAYQVLAGLYFILWRPSFLPEDIRASATTLEAVRQAAPRIEGWLQWVFAVLGGQMVAVGVLVLGGAVAMLRGRWDSPQVVTYAMAGLPSVLLMSGANFALGSDFRWFLVAPALVWLAAVITVGRQAIAAGHASQS